jgi:hypothetical protein
MKKTLLAAALALGCTGAFAADASSGPQFRFLAGAGITFGGDTLANVRFSDGSNEKIHGGGLVMLYGGGEFRLGTAMSVQATIGYHVDDSSGASNGSVRFTRVPLDLLLYYHVNEQWRIGAGVQRVSGPELKGSGVASNIHLKFDDATGTVIEGEYLFNPKMGAKLRYVNEKFTPQGGGPDADGSHFGLLFNYYF